MEPQYRGQKENALKGKNNGGGIPLGYVLGPEQKLVLDPITAPLVQEIFQRYADGEIVRTIVEDFNKRGLKTKSGKQFSQNSFNRILKNRKYIGEYQYQDVIISGGVPAIVSEDIFYQVQARLEKNKHATVPALKKQLAETERGIENMLNAIQQGILTSSTKDRLEALEKQKEDLKIAIMQAELQKPKYTKEQIVSWISQFKYGDVNSREYQKRIIDTFVNAIFLFDDYLAITYNFRGGTETITLKDIEAVYGSDLNALGPPFSENHRQNWR